MGTWRIVIEGTGCHHNDLAGVVDSNVEAQKLVDALKAGGHSLAVARFELTGRHGVVTSTDNLLDGSAIRGARYVAPDKNTSRQTGMPVPTPNTASA